MKHFKTIEFFLIFIVLPALFLVDLIALPFIVLVLWMVSFYAFIVLKKNNPTKLFKRIHLYELYVVLLRFLLIAPFLIIFTYMFLETRFFTFIVEHPITFATVFILYPILSVIPQEIIFRKFFFEHYEYPFKKKTLLMFNAIIFGWVHIIFQNYIAVIFSIAGGYIFARTYKKTKSFSLVCVEHALYGNLLFTIGLGDFFYHGSNIH